MVNTDRESTERIISDERMDFISQVAERCQALDTHVCVGIDPHPEFIQTIDDLEP